MVDCNEWHERLQHATTRHLVPLTTGTNTNRTGRLEGNGESENPLQARGKNPLLFNATHKKKGESFRSFGRPPLAIGKQGIIFFFFIYEKIFSGVFIWVLSYIIDKCFPKYLTRWRSSRLLDPANCFFAWNITFAVLLVT